MTPLDPKDDPRSAGLVTRYHVWAPTRPQSVGEHSWQVARILMSITPRPMWGVLLPHTVLHDIGEVGCGDVPYPVKAENADLGRLFEEIEFEAALRICETWELPALGKLHDPFMHAVFKLAEFIEMWEWAMEERLRGNRMVALVESRCRARVDDLIVQIGDFFAVNAYSERARQVYARAERYILRREKRWA